MNQSSLRRVSIFLSGLLLSMVAITRCEGQAIKDAKPEIGKLDPEMAAKAAAEDGLQWHDVTTWSIEGRILPEEPRERWFDRLPIAAKDTVTRAVWNLSRHSAGMAVRFQTDATAIHVDYQLMSSGLDMPHMPATGVSGIDLYAKDTDGKWKWVQVTKPNNQHMKSELVSGLAPGTREYMAYLPLYNGVDAVSFGVAPDTEFTPLPTREKPIVFYGTSITHGACASRPGMVHTAILGRKFDMPVVNLGFSGNGRMDLAVSDYLAQIDAAVYVIDCLPNMNAQAVAEKCIPFVKQLRAAKSDTPIVLVEDRRNTNSWILPSRNRHHDANHAALKQAFEFLLSDGVKGLSYIGGNSLYGDDHEGATDGSHANDLGFMRQATVFEPVIRAAIGQ